MINIKFPLATSKKKSIFTKRETLKINETPIAICLETEGSL
jgi:hypothetical protein